MSISNCPRCERPVRAISTDGPGSHRAAPCGCRIEHARLDELPTSEVRL